MRKSIVFLGLSLGFLLHLPLASLDVINTWKRLNFVERTALYNANIILLSLEIKAGSKEELINQVKNFPLSRPDDNQNHPVGIISNSKPIAYLYLATGIFLKLSAIALFAYTDVKNPVKIDYHVGEALLLGFGFLLDGIAIWTCHESKRQEKIDAPWQECYEEFDKKGHGEIYKDVSKVTLDILEYVLGFNNDLNKISEYIQSDVTKMAEQYKNNEFYQETAFIFLN